MCAAKGSNYGRREILLVLEGDLHLVPFPVLKPSGGMTIVSDSGSNNEGNGISTEYMCERFSLLVVPSLTALRANQRSARAAMLAANKNNDGQQSPNNMTALVVGNPRLPSCITEQWGWGEIPYAEQEAAMVAEMLQSTALVGTQVWHQNMLNSLTY